MIQAIKQHDHNSIHDIVRLELKHEADWIKMYIIYAF